MSVPGIICLALGLSCYPAAAQQVLVSSAATSTEDPLAGPAPAFPSAVLEIPAFRQSAPPDSIKSSLQLPGLSSANAFYKSATPQIPAAVCTQATPPFAGLPDSEYVFGHMQFSSSAIKGAWQRDHIVKMARNFVPGQPLPDAPSYVPLTSKQKFDLFVRTSHSASFGIGVLIDSFISQASGAYPKFGGGMEGYGNRLGAAAAGEGAAAFIGGYVFPTLLHQDPRYFRSHQNGVTDRLAYAASRVLIGRTDSGHSVINTSVIASQFVQAAVSNAYIPYRNETVSGTLENALAGLGSVAQADILNEFWPDIKEFFSRHNPASLLHRDDEEPDDALAMSSSKH